MQELMLKYDDINFEYNEEGISVILNWQIILFSLY
jgi:hypothetical protein